MSKFVEIGDRTINMVNITCIMPNLNGTRIYFNGSESDYFDFKISEALEKVLNNLGPMPENKMPYFEEEL